MACICRECINADCAHQECSFDRCRLYCSKETAYCSYYVAKSPDNDVNLDLTSCKCMDCSDKKN